MIHLKRFNNEGKKIINNIIPKHELDASLYLNDDKKIYKEQKYATNIWKNKYKYELYSIINHTGTCDS